MLVHSYDDINNNTDNINNMPATTYGNNLPPKKRFMDFPCEPLDLSINSPTPSTSSSRNDSSSPPTRPSSSSSSLSASSSSSSSSSIINDQPPQPVPYPPLAPVANYHCPECTKVFAQRERLMAHLRRHRTKNSCKYMCTRCNKSFVQQSSLTTHLRIHTGERPYRCKDCDQTYSDLSTYTKHQRTHSGEKPYACRWCNRRFSQSGNCLRHVRAVHNDPTCPPIYSSYEAHKSNLFSFANLK
ncbi:Protein glass, partial [Fragariocoptes setiger]